MNLWVPAVLSLSLSLSLSKKKKKKKKKKKWAIHTLQLRVYTPQKILFKEVYLPLVESKAGFYEFQILIILPVEHFSQFLVSSLK